MMRFLAIFMVSTLQAASLIKEKVCPSVDATCYANSSERHPNNPGEKVCWHYSLGYWTCQEPSEDNVCAYYTTDVRPCPYEDKVKACPPTKATCYVNSSEVNPDDSGDKVCWRYSLGYWTCQEPSEDNVCASYTKDIRQCSYNQV